MKDFYSLLGTNAGCTAAEIEAAYQKLSAKFSPNLEDPYFASRFKEITEAYEVLIDPAKRRLYDEKFNKLYHVPLNEKQKIKRYYSTGKGLNIGLTIILIGLTLVFGYHVVKLMNGSKTAKAAKIMVLNTVTTHKIKHHKRKHWAKLKAGSLAPKIKPDTVKPHPAPAQPIAVKPISNTASNAVHIATQPVTENQTKAIVPAQAVTPRTEPKPSYLYSTVIQANETGVVHMRQYATFNSALIKVIPSGSKIWVLERGNNYYKVMFENTAGYVPKWTVQDK